MAVMSNTEFDKAARNNPETVSKLNSAIMKMMYVASVILQDGGRNVAGIKDLKVNYGVANGRLPAFQFYAEESPAFDGYWNALLNTPLPEEAAITFDKDSKCLIFDSGDTIPCFINNLACKYSGPMDGFKVEQGNPRPLSEMRPEDLLMIRGNGFGSREGLEKAFIAAQNELPGNPLVNFTFTPQDLMDAYHVICRLKMPERPHMPTDRSFYVH
jgi:hypothetical protein